MSTRLTPWYRWFPGDFKADTKVQGLTIVAECIYRRALDAMWETKDCRLPNDINRLHRTLAPSLAIEEFTTCWFDEIQAKGFEILKENKDWVWSQRLKNEHDRVKRISKQKQAAGKKGGKKAAQNRNNSNGKGSTTITPAIVPLEFCSTDPDPDPDPETTNSPISIEMGVVDTDMSTHSVKKARSSLRVPIKKLTKVWHDECPDLPQVNIVDSQTRRNIKARCNGTPERYDPEWWRELIRYARKSTFLMGDNDRGWRMSFSFIFQSKSFHKLINGEYHNEPGGHRAETLRNLQAFVEEAENGNV